ncbi:GvpL/GvpF family gas vesicle protein [Xanthobacter agilis]|uniref:GvpL/GvpF family gas vesicle protein n=1 Tax=Xanthobacter agilis TaxID=47492 RepID=UPI00372ACC68
MLYVYAITADHGPEDMESLPEGILPDTPVWRIASGGLAAVASPVPDHTFGAEALPAHLEDVQWTRARVLGHERVVCALLPRATVLPLKFCTLFSGEEALRAALSAHKKTLEQTVDHLRGAREWGVKLFVEARGPDPRAPEPVGAGAGAAFFRRKKEEQQARAAAEAALDRCVVASHQRLAAHARAAVANPLQPPQLHGQRGKMALNGAYLVDLQAEPAWRACLSELERTYADEGVRYALSGPWGAYNFAGGGLVRA